jgi:hypothetical protein
MSILVNNPFWEKGVEEKYGMKVKGKKEVEKTVKNRS